MTTDHKWSSNDLECHAILYMKGWYKRTDIIKDLAIIQGHWSWMDPKFIEPASVWWFVSMIYEKYVKNKKDFGIMITEAFKYNAGLKWTHDSLTHTNLIEYLCSEIHLTATKNLNLEKYVRPDPTLLPLSERHKSDPPELSDDEACLKRWDEMHV